MATDHGIPVVRRALFALPAITGAGNDDPVAATGPVTGEPGSPVAPVTAPVTAPTAAAATGLLPVPMTAVERAGLKLQSVVGSTAVVWKPYASFAVMLCTAKPGSMAEHRQHIKSRAWVPADLTGKAATIITWAGILHHLLIARPVKAAAKTVDAAADKALRFYSLIAVLIVLFFLLSHYL